MRPRQVPLTEAADVAEAGREKGKKHALLVLLILPFLLILLLIVHAPGRGDGLARGRCADVGSDGEPGNNLGGKPRRGAACDIHATPHRTSETAWAAVAVPTQSPTASPTVGPARSPTLGPSFSPSAAPARRLTAHPTAVSSAREPRRDPRTVTAHLSALRAPPLCPGPDSASGRGPDDPGAATHCAPEHGGDGLAHGRCIDAGSDGEPGGNLGGETRRGAAFDLGAVLHRTPERGGDGVVTVGQAETSGNFGGEP
jgi:hypothetical protein